MLTRVETFPRITAKHTVNISGSRPISMIEATHQKANNKRLNRIDVSHE